MDNYRATQLCIEGHDDKKYYGGNQEWFSSNTRAMGGCSTVAGANALRALIRSDKELRHRIIKSLSMPRELKNALCGKAPSKDEYELLMTGVYNTMGTGEVPILNYIYDRSKRGKKLFNLFKPTFGRSSIGFIIGIVRFARRFGINIKVNSLTTAFCEEKKARDFIEKGLSKSGAVVMLTSYNKMDIKLYPEGADLSLRLTGGRDITTKSHFTTITDMDDDRVLITTWARPAVASFKQIVKSFKSVRSYESTLFYIELCDEKESKKCIINAWKPFFKAIIETLIRRNIEP